MTTLSTSLILSADVWLSLINCKTAQAAVNQILKLTAAVGLPLQRFFLCLSDLLTKN
jgi:hypothetical protein